MGKQNKMKNKQIMGTEQTIIRKKELFLGVGTFSYLSAEEARLKLFALIMNLARACKIVGSV